MRRSVAVAVVSAAWILAAVTGPAAWGAAESGQLTLQARIDGKAVGDGTLVIDPARTTVVEITASNETSSPLRVRTVRLSGTALALTFFAYDTTVPFDVPPGATVRRSFPLDLADLDRQATGLLPTSVTLLDPQRSVLAEVQATGDVRGSVWSVYGVFGLLLVALTLLAWAGVLVALARQRLPANRWRRALRFLPAGFGTGLSAVITLSVLRLVPPAAAAEIPLILGCAGAALALGYLTPHPGTQEPAVEPADLADADFQGNDDQTIDVRALGYTGHPSAGAAPATPGTATPGGDGGETIRTSLTQELLSRQDGTQ